MIALTCWGNIYCYWEGMRPRPACDACSQLLDILLAFCAPRTGRSTARSPSSGYRWQGSTTSGVAQPSRSIPCRIVCKRNDISMKACPTKGGSNLPQMFVLPDTLVLPFRHRQDMLHIGGLLLNHLLNVLLHCKSAVHLFERFIGPVGEVLVDEMETQTLAMVSYSKT